MSNTVYVLYDSNNKCWGVFNNDILLHNMIDTLKSTHNSASYTVKDMFMNTNLCKREYQDIEFKNNKIIDNNGKKYNKNIHRQIEKIEAMYEKFMSLKQTFSKIDIECNVPEFFKDEYKIFNEIESKKIPEEEQFNYFFDNFYYKL